MILLIMWILFYIVIVLCSITFVPDMPLLFHVPNTDAIWWPPKNAVFMIGSLMVIGASVMSPRLVKRHFYSFWLGLIFIYFSLGFGFYFFKALLFVNENGKTAFNVWNYLPTLNFIIGFFLIKTLFENFEKIRLVQLAKIFSWLAAGFSIVAIFQYIGIDQFFSTNPNYFVEKGYWEAMPGNPTMVTFMGNKFLSANFIALTAPMCLVFKDLRYKIFWFMALIAIVLLKSALSMVAFGLSFFLYLFLTRNFKWLMIILGFLFFYLFLVWQIYPKYFEYFSLSGRFDNWIMAFKDSLKTFYFGAGLGSFGHQMYMSGDGRHFMHAHLEWLQFLKEGGIVLVFLVCAYLNDLIKRIIATPPVIMLIGFISVLCSFLVIMSGGFPLRIAPLALVGLITIAALEYLTRGEEVHV